ncbi:LLM class flavin-dependent oxidoreductase [Sphingopyxis sp. MG]|uniref:LLM class flavin-dependent oxidoreductase n=1 Tax=Sphingopyxis sp. MG TaxID=1866325 RepID=UPI000CDF3B15|nr:LLM class flavin-dependent oxidoreductase [Sphingopyxis sp. MG]AVA14672.1 hypothetical protein C3E99_13125 [Sphingopyxis sp. MG]
MSKTVEIWSSLTAPGSSQDPRMVAKRAQRLEKDGWSGGAFPDSQLIAGEAFATLAWCAARTSTLKLGTGTSNPSTRHPSVLAGAAATIQAISEGRMTLSIGRGDSSLAYIGAPPASLGIFEKALATIRTYLAGEDVSAENAVQFLLEKRDFSNLAIGESPESSPLKWLPEDYTPPELEVAATGPKVIAIAARHADRIGLALGASVERLKWAIATAREELERTGRDPAQLKFGAYIPCYPHANHQLARDLSQGMVASMSRFSVMNKHVVGPVTDQERANLERVASTYDMKNHGANSSKQSEVLDPEFIDKFGLVGDPAVCVERILELRDLGIDKFMLWTADTEGVPGESYACAVEEVLPKVMPMT